MKKQWVWIANPWDPDLKSFGGDNFQTCIIMYLHFRAFHGSSKGSDHFRDFVTFVGLVQMLTKDSWHGHVLATFLHTFQFHTERTLTKDLSGMVRSYENNIPHIYIDFFWSEKMGAKFISINPSHLNPQLSFPSVAIPSPSPPRPTTHDAHLVFKAQRNSGASEPWVSDGGSSGSGTRIVAI